MSRRTLCLPVCAAALAAATAAAAGGASTASSFAFGRVGGNIRPYTVTIRPGGAVTLSGPVTAHRVTQNQLVALRALVVQTRFTTLPLSKRCTGTLPDVASTFIRVGARTVRVHGSCLPGYNKLWLALRRAVGLSGMT